jgi:hypothetical protein
MSTVYELFLVACVGLNVCDYVAVPVAYETESACARQAALIAGMVNGRYDIAESLIWRFECTATEEATVAADPLAVDTATPVP